MRKSGFFSEKEQNLRNQSFFKNDQTKTQLSTNKNKLH